jgi:hypothetical protein
VVHAGGEVSRLRLGLALLALAFAPRAAHAVGEVNGRIKGNVVEAQTQAPVPGAQVKVSGKALIGNARVVVTGDDGSFQVYELPPGPYTVEVSYQGVKPIKKAVVVRQGETYPLDIQWSAELAEQEVTVVEESRRMTRPDQNSTGTVLTSDQMKRVATQRDYQDVAQQVASVTDVSGNGNPEIKGANYTQTRYMIDGLDITDPVTGTFSANINFDTISSIQVLTGGMEAQYNSMGGIINLITDGGSDDWKVNSSFYINNAKFSAGNQFGARLSNGIKLFDPTPRPVTQAYQANLSVGGPIVKHKLWFNVSLQYDYTEEAHGAAPPLNVTTAPRRFNGVQARLKITWAPSDKHRIQLSLSGDPAFIDNDNQDPGGLPVTEFAQIQGGAFVTLLYNYFASDKKEFDLQTGFQYNRLYFGPMGILRSVDNVPNGYSARANTYDPNAAQHVNQTDNTTWYQGGDVGDDRRYTFQFDPSISLRGKAAGTHDAKIGLQSRYVVETFNGYTPGGSRFIDSGGGPFEAGICNETTGNGCFQRIDIAPTTKKIWGYSLGGFIQDKWQPLKRLIIVPGIRVDWGITKNTLGQTVSNLFGFGPRLGMIVDITGDQKTMFKAFYGRSNEVMSLLPATNADVQGLSTVNVWDPASHSFVKDHTTGGTNGYRLDPYGNTPHVDEVTVSINREIFKDSVLEVDYTYKHFGNQWDSIELNQIWDPTGSRVVGYKNGNQEQIFRYSRPGDNWREYQGIDFTLESRPNEHWDLYAAYTLAWLYGPGIETFGQINATLFNQSQFYNPRMAQFYDGFTPNDVRHTIKLRASYNWKGLNVGTFLQFITGTPQTHLYWNQQDGQYQNRRSPTGTDPGSKAAGNTPNDVTQISEFRIPDQLSVDLRASYDFHKLIKQHLMVIFDFFNLFNLGTTNQIEVTDIAQFGLATQRQKPFQMQLGLRYDY